MQIQYRGEEYYKHNPDYHRFADFMGLKHDDRMNTRRAGKLSTLYDWAKLKSGSEDFGEIATTMNMLKRHLGVNFVGETLINELYKWVRLEMDRFRKDREKEFSEEKREQFKDMETLKIDKDRQKKKELLKNRDEAKFDSEQEVQDLVRLKPDAVKRVNEKIEDKTGPEAVNTPESVDI